MNATTPLPGQIAGSLRYDAATISLHWITAALVIGLWALGQVADTFPRGAPRDIAWSMHVAAGLLLAVAIAARTT
jgi:cytochrome b561